MHGLRLLAAQAFTVSLPSFVPIAVGTNTTFPERPGTCGFAVDRFGPSSWSMFTTLTPLEIAALTSLIRPVPKIGWTMMASYCFDVAAVWSCENCVFGSLFASRTVIVALPFAAAFAAANIGAS